MRIPIYQVDAFASRVFGGNPAAVCPLERWLPDATMQAIAAENNLSETAFLVPDGGEWAIRWFTPEVEVDLCGHATLAAAHVLLGSLEPSLTRVAFRSRSGDLAVSREGELLSMVFPSRPATPVDPPPALLAGLGHAPVSVLLARDFLAVFASEEEVRALTPDMDELRRLDGALGVIATAPGRSADFVSRFFAPRVGVPEDPVTGSAHCTLIPFWSARLSRTSLRALQVSRRGGELFCHERGNVVSIAGRAVTYLEGAIEIPDDLTSERQTHHHRRP